MNAKIPGRFDKNESFSKVAWVYRKVKEDIIVC